MNFCTLQDAYGVKTFKSPKVMAIGQKGRGLRGVHDTPEKPPSTGLIGAPAGGCEVQEDVLMTKARQETPTVVETPPVQKLDLPPLFNFNLDRMDLGLIVFAFGCVLLVSMSRR